MAIFRRKSRSPRDTGMPRVRAGVLAIVVIAIGTYFGFTKANPFASPYKLTAAFDTVNNLKENSPVRIAGVEVGKVTEVKAVTGDSGAAVVTMEIKDKALPIHEDATMKIRPRIFLEGNFFVDVEPGSPSAPILEDDEKTIPTTQTAAPVQFGDLLAALQSDTRADLQVFLQEYAKGLQDGGAEGFNKSIPYWKPAYKNSALANDASLGIEPTRDIQRLLKGQAGTARGLASDEEALKGVVTNLNAFTGALAREDVALEASIPLLRSTLRVAQPALKSLNDSLPSLRRFAIDALPAARSSGPTLEASIPFIRQLRGLVQPSELQGLARELRRSTPRLVRLNLTTIPLLEQGRTLSACTNKVLVPLITMTPPDLEFGDVNTGSVNQNAARGLVGLSGESRHSDGGTQYFRGSAVALGDRVRPGPPSDGGNQPPPRRPDQPCELQQLPNLRAPGGPSTAFAVTSGSPTAANQDAFRPRKIDEARRGRLLLKARDLFLEIERKRRARLERRAEGAKLGG
jgi:phospholipid/cholesterol/gamma-HCH transport system substrate-binding protein